MPSFPFLRDLLFLELSLSFPLASSMPVSCHLLPLLLQLASWLRSAAAVCGSASLLLVLSDTNE